MEEYCDGNQGRGKSASWKRQMYFLHLKPLGNNRKEFVTFKITSRYVRLGIKRLVRHGGSHLSINRLYILGQIILRPGLGFFVVHVTFIILKGPYKGTARITSKYVQGTWNSTKQSCIQHTKHYNYTEVTAF